MTHFSQQDNFSVAARVLGALFYYAPESAEAAPLVAVLTNDSWETQWPLPEASLAPLVTAFQTQSEETHAQAFALEQTAGGQSIAVLLSDLNKE